MLPNIFYFNRIDSVVIPITSRYKKFLAFGPPICPQDRAEMEAIGDWEVD